jgi:hypothetical protein
MKSLEVTLFLNQTPADGVALVWLQERFYFARHCQRQSYGARRAVVLQELYKAWLMPAASKADGVASVLIFQELIFAWHCQRCPKLTVSRQFVNNIFNLSPALPAAI